MRRRPRTEPLLLALVAGAGCFTDYAPTIDEPGASSSSAGPSSTGAGTTGAAGESTGTSTGDPLLDSHGESDASSSGTTGATTIVLPETSTTTPVDPLEQCLAQSGQLACGDCLCDKCLAEYTACVADRGCVAIEACAAEHGCNDAQCLGPCGEVIEMNGGIGGESLKLAIALSDCFNNSCCGP